MVLIGFEALCDCEEEVEEMSFEEVRDTFIELILKFVSFLDY